MAFRRWFPLSLQEQATFFTNFTRVFSEVALDLGFTADDISKLEADNAVMQYLVLTELNVKTFKRSFQALRDGLTKGKGINTLVYVQYTPFPEPPIVPCGIFERLFRLADRIMHAKGYTQSTGARLGILPKAQEALQPEDLRPKLKIRLLGDGKIEVRFVRRRMSGINLFFRRVGSEALHDLGRFFRSPAVVEVPLANGNAEKIYVSGRYLAGNEPVGVYSSWIEMVVAP